MSNLTRLEFVGRDSLHIPRQKLLKFFFSVSFGQLCEQAMHEMKRVKIIGLGGFD